MKKILRILFLFIFVLVVALLLLPFVYKEELVGAVRDAVNKNINAEVDFEDLDLSFIKSFPDVSITIHKPAVNNDSSFNNAQLLKAESLRIDMDFMSFIQTENPYIVNSIELENGVVNLIIDKAGNYNYEIWKTNEEAESTDYTLELNKYTLSNVDLIFNDQGNQTKINALNINHTGKGDFTQDIFNLSTDSDIASLSIIKNNVPYLNKIRTKGTLDLKINNQSNTYTINNNDIRLGNLKVNTEGFVQLLGDDIKMDLDISSGKTNFGDFLTVLPLDLKQNLSGLETKGSATVHADVKGTYSDSSLPAINSTINIENGYVKNSAFPEPIKNVFTNLTITANDKKWDDLEIDLADLKLNIAGEDITGRFKYKDVMTDPSYDLALKGNIDLDKVNKILPLENIQSMQGTVMSDIKFKGKQSQIESEKYDALDFDMQMESSGLQIDYKDGNDIALSKFDVSSTPKKLNIQSLEGTIGSSDYKINGTINNPLAILTAKNNISGELIHSSNAINLDEWMTESESSSSSTIDIDQNLVDNSQLKFKSEINTIKYLDYEIKDFEANGKLTANRLDINNSKIVIQGSTVQANGNLRNAYNYITKNDSLYGKLDIYSPKFDMNKFVTEGETTQAEALRIPRLYNIELDLKVDEVLYSKTGVKQFNSDLFIKDGVASLVNSTSQAMGGRVDLEGFYNSITDNPEFSFKYEISKFNFQETFKNLASFRVLAPVAEFIEGVFNSTLVMNGNLKNGFEIDYSTLSATGFLETLNSKFSGFEPITNLANRLGVDNLKQINLDNTKNWFEVEDGGVVLKANDYMFDDIKMRIGGKQNFNSGIDYVAHLEIPRSRFKNSTIGNIGDKGIGFLEGEAEKLGVNLDVGDFIYLDVNITGTIKNPKFKIVPKGAGGKSLKETTKDIVNNVIEDKKKEYTDKANEKINSVRDSVTTVVTNKRDTLIAQAEEKANMAIKAAKDTITAKVKAKAVAVVKDSLATKLEDKVKDVLGDQSSEVDKLKDKLKNKIPGFPKKKN